MESLKRQQRAVLLLAGLGIVALLLLTVPSLRRAGERNILSFRSLTMVQGMDWTDPKQVCTSVAPPPPIISAGCADDAQCYAASVVALRTGDWRAAQQPTTQEDLLTTLMQGWGAWCGGSPADAVVYWKKDTKLIGRKFLQEAEEALVQGDLETALAGAKIAHEIEPSSKPWLLMAKLYIQLKNTELALEASRGALLSGDISAETYFQTGGLEWQLRDLTAARSHLAKAVERAPNNSIYWHVYGSVLYQLQDWENSEHAFIRATKLDPTYPHSFAGLAMVELKQGKLAMAQDAIQKMLKNLTEDSTKAAYLAEYARLAAEAGGFEQAVTFYARAVQLLPENNDIWFGMLNLYANKGACAELAQVYEKYAAYAVSHQKTVAAAPQCSPKP